SIGKYLYHIVTKGSDILNYLDDYQNPKELITKTRMKLYGEYIEFLDKKQNL
ncbi:21585_t:CDS:1, partial [Entrophospora sp. SA101]